MVKKVLIATLLIFFVACVQAEIVVIGNLKGPELLSSTQVQDIFMGRTHSLSNGEIVIPIEQSSLRTEFYQKLTSKPIEQIDAYWARITFTGQAPKLEILPDDNKMLTKISRGDENAIGYIDKNSIDIVGTTGVDKKNSNNKVRVLLILN